MKNLDSAEHLDKKLDESKEDTQSGRKAVGIDIFIAPIRRELHGAQMFLAKDRRRLMANYLEKEQQEIIQELSKKNLNLLIE